MEFMDFSSEQRGLKISSVSKTKLQTLDLCQTKAYKKERFKEEDSTRALLVGKAAHEMFAKKMSKIKEEQTKKPVPYTPKFTPSPSILREAKTLIKYINFDNLVGSGKIVDIENFVETTLPNEIKLVGVFDLVIFRDDPNEEFRGAYIEVVDYKTSFVVSKEVDNEAILYAYLAAKIYGLPVNFKRFSGRGGADNSFEHYFDIDFESDDEFNENSLSFMEKSIALQAENYKKVVESNEEPIPTAGAHCASCPFLDQCIEKGYAVDDLDGMINQQRLYAAKAKELKNEIKAYSMEKGGEVSSEMYTTFIKETRSPKLMIKDAQTKKTKTITKKAFVKLLSEANILEKFVNDLDIKYTPEVIQEALDLGLEFGETVKRDIQIELTRDYEDTQDEED